MHTIGLFSALVALHVVPKCIAAVAVPTHLFAADTPPRASAPVTGSEDSPCRIGKGCCSFRLRIYQHCIPLPNNFQGRVETWPLFHTFLDADQNPIASIAGDYNRKVCDGCDPAQKFGNITGPNGLFVRWNWFEEARSEYDVFWDVTTYWVNNDDGHYYEDHRDRGTCNFRGGAWSEFDEDHRKWGDACRFLGEEWFNRTRVSLSIALRGLIY